jgi:glucose-1-phosphate cytidylyltransferase
LTGAALPPVAILCGGRGTRLRERTQEIPKPLVEIGGMPIVWHVIGLYVRHGFDRFLLATGYRGEQIEAFVAEQVWPEGIGVECIDTGAETNTGGRLAALAPAPAREERFCATYADGLAAIDLRALVAEHRAHGALATMTVVRPELQFGVAEIDGSGAVRGFHEKPRTEQWINGGFFCFEAAVLGRLAPDSVLEREPLAALAADGQLRAHRHEGFWECMDTYKDAVALDDLWRSGQAPWPAMPSARAATDAEQADGVVDPAQPPLPREREAVVLD